ncbi:MAG: zf-TFIIB domain-containing protein [Lachnospiraceae bacterium]|nr:zf-TFIIB domain-containing protein [Lachnospiraceae bacterium]
MKCPECGDVFKKEGNRAERIDGTKITVCPNCGNEQLD